MFLANLEITYEKDFNHDLNHKGFLVRILNSYVNHEQKVIDIIEINGLISEKELKKIVSKYDYAKDFRYLGQTKDKTFCKLKVDWNTSNNVCINNNCYTQFPIICKDKKEYWKLLCEKKEDLKKIIAKLNIVGKKCKLISVLEYKTHFNGLTSKQIEVLEYSFEKGYFDIPRKNDSTKISKDLGLSQSTFAVHIQKSIQKLVSSYFNR